MTTARTSLHLCWAALAVAAIAAFGVLAGPASAAKPCERQVIDDWYDNGRVDQIYKAACYRAAVKILPTDVIDYSSAKDDILRALSFAVRGADDPGQSGGTGTTPTTPSAAPPPPVSTETTAKPLPKPTETTDTTDATETVDGVTEAVPAADTASSSSLPIPLLVLGGLAILLFAAGAAGYLSRRFRANGPGGDPPASA